MLWTSAKKKKTNQVKHEENHNEVVLDIELAIYIIVKTIYYQSSLQKEILHSKTKLENQLKTSIYSYIYH